MRKIRLIHCLALVAIVDLATNAPAAAHPAAPAVLSGSETVSRGETVPGLVRRAAVATSADRALPSAASTPRDLEAAFSTAEPLSLAAGDFDGDGVPDLAAAYRIAAGSLGLIAVWRGNVDAVYGWTPEARARRAAGTFTEAPFLGPPALLALPEPADFLATGDFDGDGRKDLVAGAAGGSAVYLVSGDGRGVLAPAEAIPLPGRITAWASGEVNRRDGLGDLVVAIDGESGPNLLVFEGPNGALAWEPEVIALAEPAEDLALGELDGDFWVDVAVSGARGVTIVHGRDRRLSVSAAARAAVLPARVTSAGVSLGKQVETAVAEAFARQNPLGGGPGGPDGAVAGGAMAGLEMRLDADAFADLVLLEEGDPEPGVVVNAIGTTWTVNTTADTTDGSCDALGSGSGNQDCTFREALTVAASGDSIHFAIPCGTPCPFFPPVISPGSALPLVPQGVTIDGTTQSQGSIVLAGGAAGTDVPGLRVTGSNTVVRGLRIGSFDGNGIELAGGGNTVEQCYVGLSGLGSSAGNGGAGILITGSDNTVGCTGVTPCNVISANGSVGIRVEGEPDAFAALTTIWGNYIGTNPGGTSGLENAAGIVVENASQTSIGGATVAERNVISGNVGNAISLLFSELTLIQGNYIGTNASGDGLLQIIKGRGIRLGEVTATTIGGTASGACNVISGYQDGIFYGFSGTTNGTLIQGNYIGTDATGSVALGNSGGVAFIGNDPSTNDVIGGAVPGAGNLISASRDNGIRFVTRSYEPNILGAEILGNLIGTDSSGTGDLGNGDAGVSFLTEDAESLVPLGDGSEAGENKIAYNGCGVLILKGNRRPVRGNQITENDSFGIGLADLDLSVTDGCSGERLTPNDLLDLDSGPNDLTNFPVLDSVTTASGTTTVAGTYHGAQSASIDLDFYSNLACDPSGFGEGEEYLGSTMVTTNASGNAAFSFQPSSPVPAGRWVTATATKSSSTSEFSACRRENATCGAPENVVLEGGSINFVQAYEACQTITAAGDEADPLTVEGVGDLTLRAGESVAILDGFSVEGGLEIAIDPTLAP